MRQTRMAGKRLLAWRAWAASCSTGLLLLPFVGCQCTASPPAVKVLPVPQLADICTWSGKTEGVVSGLCPRHENYWHWIVEAGFGDIQPGDSDLEACPVTDGSYLASLPNPGWLLRLEKTRPLYLNENTTDQFTTAIVATRVDGSAPCSVLLLWNLKQQKFVLPMGIVIRWTENRTILDLEKDAFRASVIRDEQGQFLMGVASGIRPEVWYKDLWPELGLFFDPSPVCRGPDYPEVLQLRVTLSNGQDICTLDSGTGRCCTFAGTQYQVQVADAHRSALGEYPDRAWLLVARQDLLASAL